MKKNWQVVAGLAYIITWVHLILSGMEVTICLNTTLWSAGFLHEYRFNTRDILRIHKKILKNKWNLRLNGFIIIS